MGNYNEFYKNGKAVEILTLIRPINEYINTNILKINVFINIISSRFNLIGECSHCHLGRMLH